MMADYVFDQAGFNALFSGWELVAAKDPFGIKKFVWQARDRCNHKWMPVRFQQANGIWRASLQCAACLSTDNHIKSPSDLMQLPYRVDQDVVEKLYDGWIAKIDGLRKELDDEAKREDKQHYQQYLSTPAWRNKRSAVIARCKNVCEGCGSAPVEDIHHLTYEHKYNEFLFELVGLCRRCHERAHGLGRDKQETSVETSQISQGQASRVR